MQRKIALVTGAGKGLGFATSMDLAKKGYQVLMVARSLDKLKKAVQDVDCEGLSLELFEADITRAEDVQRLKEQVIKKVSHLDVLVNNAGVFLESLDSQYPEKTSALHVHPDVVLRTFESNTLGAFRMCQAFIPLMKKNGYGRVVNVSSGMGQLSEMEGNWPGYRMSKTAMNAMTRVLASELKGSNIKVNSVCPGWVRTDMGGPNAQRTIEEGIAGIVWAATLQDDGPTGGFFRDGKTLEW